MEYKAQRLKELLKEPRVLGGDDPKNPGLNYVQGLLALIHECKPKYVVEIGSFEGVSTECFLLNCKEVTVIDPWLDENVFKTFMFRVGSYPNLTGYRQYSVAGLMVPPHSVDMVYIDGSHFYDAVIQDIELARLAVKEGGYVAGHDYVKDDAVNTEVPKAVLEAFGREPDKVFEDTSWIIKV